MVSHVWVWVQIRISRIHLCKPADLGIIEPDSKLEHGEVRVLVVRVVPELTYVLVRLTRDTGVTREGTPGIVCVRPPSE